MTTVDPKLDVARQADTVSDADAKTYARYAPDALANAPVSLQVVAPHFRDEQAMGLACVVSEALSSSHGRAT